MIPSSTEPPTADEPRGASGQHESRPERALAIRTLALRARAQGPSGTGRGALAAIAMGIHPMTEAGAFPYTESVLQGLNPNRRIGARRVAAMIATHRSTTHTDQWVTIGTTLRRFHDTDQGSWPGTVDTKGNIKRTALSMQIDSLPLLDIESASQIISGLVGRCARRNVSVNFMLLASTLTDWGTGYDATSRERRNRVVLDFYGLSD